MCRICVEWEQGKLTSKEAFRNIGEAINTTDDDDTREHLFGLSERILDKEVAPADSDDEMDQAWHKENYGDS